MSDYKASFVLVDKIASFVDKMGVRSITFVPRRLFGLIYEERSILKEMFLSFLL